MVFHGLFSLLLGTRSYSGLLAPLLGARTLLGVPGLTTRNNKLLGIPFSCAHMCPQRPPTRRRVSYRSHKEPFGCNFSDNPVGVFLLATAGSDKSLRTATKEHGWKLRPCGDGQTALHFPVFQAVITYTNFFRHMVFSSYVSFP